MAAGQVRFVHQRLAERLGHARVSTTMEIYAHVLPDMQQDAARSLSALLYGR
jgi:integrase